ncbi:MAG: Glu-tRNA(Gln) amidotransferase subunit GatD [Thermoprotei archaeon]|jgi:glutamyl-tRNA(Gln) amidotransferase subunit D
MLDPLYGYRGIARKLLEIAHASIGDTITIKSKSLTYTGILMPRYETADPNHITIKLENGYNIGVRVDENTIIEVKQHGEKSQVSSHVTQFRGLPYIVLVGVGGTIMSRIDYVTGAVKPSFTVADLIEVVPGITEKYDVKMIELLKIFSEDMKPEYWSRMAETAAREIMDGAEGIIIAHGTDTMGYSAAALSFALRNLPVPVIFVGAQRSSDRPSSDAAVNLKAAITYVTKGPYSGVFVVMHGGLDDDICHVHRGTKVRKLHTSRRDAFRTVNSNIVAEIRGEQISIIDHRYLLPRDKSRRIELYPKFEPKVALIKTYPGISSELIDYLLDKNYRGIVIEGTGLGHVPEGLVRSVQRASEMGIVVVIASQCIWGRVNMNVYSRGRELLAAGAIGAEDMLPETALVKLMWVLGQGYDYKDAKKIMLTNIAGEIEERSFESWRCTQ